MAKIEFNSSEQQGLDDFSPLPAGQYFCTIRSSERKPCKSGKGSYYELVWEVLEPERYVGRKLWDRLNLDNESREAVEIAQKRLTSICRATGVLVIEDTAELHEIPCVLTLRITPPKGDFGPRNDISAYGPESLWVWAQPANPGIGSSQAPVEKPWRAKK